ncbi:MAG: hypothetical protein M1829_000040 [Trizodia sp. TS-e1964]|nr:MAG: hypothetical protein M1829_000040 [Trizodia sp. TS-e1964]
MADAFAPPAGPPPPKAPSVPEGWKAQFNDEYKEWFYVNLYTKKSQWEKPTEPAHAATDHLSPDGPPPSYEAVHSPGQGQGDRKVDAKSYPGATASGGSSSQQSIEADARYAAQLQAEEDARADTPPTRDINPRGRDGYAGRPGYDYAPYDTIPLPPRPNNATSSERSPGLLGKLFNKVQSSTPHRGDRLQRGSGQGQMGYYPGGYGQNDYSQTTYGHPIYGFPPRQGYAQPYGPQLAGPYGQPPPRRGGGIGAGGAAALGVGGGVLGGVLLAEALDNHNDNQAYEQGYDQGVDNANDYGGGGDFGGDF